MSKFIFLIVGCSGCGKTTITEQLEKRYGLKSIQSYTTRPKRFYDETGHTFVTDDEFDKLTNYVAYTEFAGFRYCATAEQVEDNDLYVIDPKGVEFFINAYKGDKIPKIIFINSDLTTRYERMVERAEAKSKTYTEAIDEALNRIKNDVNEFYDYIHKKATIDCTINNNKDDNLDNVVDKIYNYICSCESEVN